MGFYLDAVRTTSREFLVFYRWRGRAGFFPVHLGLS
jgi:hypothetical protein